MIGYNQFNDFINRYWAKEERINKFLDALEEMFEDTWSCCERDNYLPISILEAAFNDEKDNWISYWIYELDYGEKWKPGTVTDKNGNDIPLKTTKDLYDFLMEGMKENE